jgi:hypothetical protein
MISRERFEEIKDNYKGKTTKEPKREEVIDFLKVHGSRLSEEDAKEILKEVFKVCVGDTILTSENAPVASVDVSVGGKAYKMFTLYSFMKDFDNVYIDIVKGNKDSGKIYRGNTPGFGIFIFFLDPEMIVIRPVEE